MLPDWIVKEDIVFAESTGYIPWPAIVLEIMENDCMVQFCYTDETSKISHKKIWPYNDETKLRFSTKENRAHKDFAAAIYIAERVHKLGISGFNKSFTSSSELEYLREVRGQSDTLNVEPDFVAYCNEVRQNLARSHQKYDLVMKTLNLLLEMPISKLLLLRNREAVESIAQICNFVSTRAADQTNAKEVRFHANRLVLRFRDAFAPTELDMFWQEYGAACDLYRKFTIKIGPKNC